MEHKFSFTARMVQHLQTIERARDLLAEWIKAGWLEIDDPARKSRRYHLSAEYRRFIG